MIHSEPPMICAEQESRPEQLKYHHRMDLRSPAEAPAAPNFRDRADVPERFKWNLTHIFVDWTAWQAAFDELDTKIGAYAALQGSLSKGAEYLLAAMKLSDDIGQLTYKVWYFA